MNRITLKASLSLAVAFSALVTVAADSSADPAVSAPNGKISLFGGASADEVIDDQQFGGGLMLSGTVPLDYSFGLQVDGAIAGFGEFGALKSGGAHLFWRDPNQGLFGVYLGGAANDTVEFGRAGVEGQVYLSNITFDFAVGTMFGDLDDIYGRARLDFYLSDDWVMKAGYARTGIDYFTYGSEYQIDSGSGMSLFSESRIHDFDNYTSIMGLRFYFGEPATLKDRHRRQDPEDYFTDDAAGSSNAVGVPAKPDPCPQPARASVSSGRVQLALPAESDPCKVPL